MVKVEHNFTLPIGLVDQDGIFHRNGVMRMANASDEILTMVDPNVEINDAFIPLVLLSRVITHIGPIHTVTPELIGQLFTADMAYLQDMYLRINSSHPIILQAACPHCTGAFHLQVAPITE